MDPKLISDVQVAEGLRLTAYKDSLGFWTIGYGHFLYPQSKDWTGFAETQEQANEDLSSDLLKAKSAAMILPEWPSLDTPCRQNAIIELVFNMGAKWRGFVKCRLDIQNQNWQCAHDELLNSLWAKEVGPARSTRLANYLKDGEYVGSTN